MLEQLFMLIPEEARASAGWLASGGAGIGACLWLGGSLFSRSLVTLGAVALGAFLGLRVPAWAGLPIGDWAIAVAGALILGVFAFVAHKLWSGAILGLLVAAWGFVAAWSVAGPGRDWHVPSQPADMSLFDYARTIWYSLPHEFQRIAPLGAGIGLAAGLAISLMWHRFSLILLHTLLGSAMLLMLGGLALRISRPQTLAVLSQDPVIRWTSVAGILLIGILAQWWVYPTPAPPKHPELVRQKQEN